MLNYFNPSNTLKVINKLQKFIFALFIAVLILGLFEALVLSPEDYKQSDSVRIMYVHVPAAWISLGIFSVISILSFGILIFKNNKEYKINNTEKIILEKMINNPGKTFERMEIGKLIDLSKERSIDVIITRLRKKIELDPKNPKFLQTIRGAGYVLWIE